MELHERFVDALGVLATRAGQEMPRLVQEAIGNVGSAARILQSAVSHSLPAIPPGVSATAVTPERAQPMDASEPEKLPMTLPAMECLALKLAARALHDLVRLLEPEHGENGASTAGPRD